MIYLVKTTEKLGDLEVSCGYLIMSEDEKDASDRLRKYYDKVEFLSINLVQLNRVLKETGAYKIYDNSELEKTIAKISDELKKTILAMSPVSEDVSTDVKQVKENRIIKRFRRLFGFKSNK